MPDEPYRVKLTPAAEKDLDRLKNRRDQAVRTILRLEQQPHLGHPLVGGLRGVRSLKVSLPGGAVHRAAYILVEEERVVVVFLVGPHENFYKKAERRWESFNPEGTMRR